MADGSGGTGNGGAKRWKRYYQPLTLAGSHTGVAPAREHVTMAIPCRWLRGGFLVVRSWRPEVVRQREE